MTKINKIVMQGFKSFARRTELTFGDKFNCVLGPNGSGKSNVIDALCFVLGRTSAKSLRAEKSANLIYNGGKTKKPMNKAEVSIFFDNNSKEFGNDINEVKVSRFVKSNGQSVYKINDETMTRQQVLEMLGRAKINPDGFNIILQMDIVSFIEMSSLERRKIIEEVSGVAAYEEKKNKALSDLGKVDEHLKEAEIILTERQSYLKELKKERDQALKYKDLDSNMKVAKASSLHRQIDKKEKLHGGALSKIDEFKNKFDEYEKKIGSFKSSIDANKLTIASISEEIEKKGEKEQVALHKEVEALKVALATHHTKIENAKSEIEKVKGRKEQLKSEHGETIVQLKVFDEKISELEKEQNGILKEKKRIEDELVKFKKKHNMDDAFDMDKKVEALDREAEESQAKIQSLREKQQNLLREKDKIEYDLKSIDDQFAKVKEVEKEHAQAISALKQQKVEFKKAVVELNQCLQEDSVFAAQIGNNKRKLSEAEENLSKLETKNAVAREKIGYNVAVKKVVSSKLRGVIGTVADIGEVSSKYSTALGVAAGNKMNSIVVEDDKAAAEAIKYLKTNKFGVASFIPLNKIKAPAVTDTLSKFSSAKGVHGRAIDLITYDSRYKKVFTYVFGDTLVVDDLEVARRIGIGTIKMVTLDGDLADSSGVMKGGFREKNAGVGFSERDVSAELEKVSAFVSELSSIISTLEKKRSENETEISRLREFKASLEGEIIKTEKSLHLESGDLDASKEKKEELSKRLKEVDSEFDNVISSISDVNKILANNKIAKASMREKINSLRSPAVIAELNAFEGKNREFRDRLVQIEAEIKNIFVQKEMIASDSSKIIEVEKQYLREEDKFKNEIHAFGLKIKEDEKLLVDKELKQKEFYAKFKELFNKRSKLQEEITKAEGSIESVRLSSREIEIKMNNLGLENAKVAAELSGLKNEFSAYEGVVLDNSRSDEELLRDIKKFENMLANMEAVNMKALDIYDNIEAEYGKLVAKKETLVLEKNDVLVLIASIEGAKKDLFMKTFTAVNEHFKSIFSALSTKGQASLLLENPEKPFDEGLRVMVRLTGSKFLDIRSLSGGEKTMTALAFIFAIQEYDPHSFYIMDEVDAALDKHNAEKLAKLVRQYTSKAQYVVISHNDALISEADRLYGVSMDEHGVTNVTSLKL